MKIIDILKLGDKYRYFLIEDESKIRWIEFNEKKEVVSSNFDSGSNEERKLAEFVCNVRKSFLLSDI